MPGKKKLLIADDDKLLHQMYDDGLGEDYDILHAYDGADALTLAVEHTPDAILLDIMMKDMDGWEVLKLLKMDEATRDIPVVIISARTEPKDKIRGLQEGDVDYVTKPFVVRDVLDRIARILGSEGVA